MDPGNITVSAGNTTVVGVANGIGDFAVLLGSLNVTGGHVMINGTGFSEGPTMWGNTTVSGTGSLTFVGAARTLVVVDTGTVIVTGASSANGYGAAEGARRWPTPVP